MQTQINKKNLRHITDAITNKNIPHYLDPDLYHKEDQMGYLICGQWHLT